MGAERTPQIRQNIVIAIVLGMRLLLPLDGAPVYFFVLIFSFFQWDFYSNVLYPTLIMDYFSTLEYFNNLSLDKLLLLDQAIEQQQVLAGQTIYDQGNWGTHLDIVAVGQVRLLKTIGGQSKTLRTLVKEHFGGKWP